MKYAMISDKGLLRENNEDSVYASMDKSGNLDNVFIVADGMGGYNAGDIASKYSIDFFNEYVYSSECEDILDILYNGVKYSNEKVYSISHSNHNYNGMGTTFIVATIRDNDLYFANVGDSRLYIINKESIKLVSSDNSLVNELLKKGEITEEEAIKHPKKNVITRAVGTEIDIKVDLYSLSIDREDIVIMCSDGFSNMLDNEEIYNHYDFDVSLEENIKNLLNIALNNGGTDNISVIIFSN